MPQNSIFFLVFSIKDLISLEPSKSPEGSPALMNTFRGLCICEREDLRAKKFHFTEFSVSGVRFKHTSLYYRSIIELITMTLINIT